jgi:hypothetical protein
VDERKEVRKFLGLCVQCDAELDRKGSYCTKCHEKKKISRAKSRRKLYEQGICPCCKGPVEKEGAWFCKARTDFLREQAKARTIFRRENGLCVQCGKPSDAGSQCRVCLDKDRIRRNTKPLGEEGISKAKRIFNKQLIEVLENTIESVQFGKLTKYNEGYIDACNDILFKLKDE